MPNVALYEPKIPGNTGNIIRLCANAGADLFLLGRLGFDLDDRRLRRAGLDYHELASVHHIENADDFIEAHLGRLVALSTRARRSLFERRARPEDILLLGPETRGLPFALLEKLPEEQVVYIPMRPTSRSLNLSNAAAIALYETWRQLEFNGAAERSEELGHARERAQDDSR